MFLFSYYVLRSFGNLHTHSSVVYNSNKSQLLIDPLPFPPHGWRNLWTIPMMISYFRLRRLPFKGGLGGSKKTQWQYFGICKTGCRMEVSSEKTTWSVNLVLLPLFSTKSTSFVLKVILFTFFFYPLAPMIWYEMESPSIKTKNCWVLNMYNRIRIKRIAYANCDAIF